MDNNAKKKFIHAKILNRSASDRLRNIELRLSIIHSIIYSTDYILDDYYKCKWLQHYKDLGLDELSEEWFDLFNQAIELYNIIKTRGLYMLKLRGNRWSI